MRPSDIEHLPLVTSAEALPERLPEPTIAPEWLELLGAARAFTGLSSALAPRLRKAVAAFDGLEIVS